MADQAKSGAKPFVSDPAAQLPHELANGASSAAVSLPELKRASESLKGRIDEAKRRSDLPLDSALGNPEQERAAADGRLDLPEDEDD